LWYRIKRSVIAIAAILDRQFRNRAAILVTPDRVSG
jgi:hypothetical protein